MRDVYAGIDQLVLTESFAASPVCRALEVSRSGFYAWRSGEESRREAMDRQLVPEISEIFWSAEDRGRVIAAWHCIRSGESRPTPEKPGFAGDSAEVVSADDRQPDTVWATTKTY